MKTLLFLIGMLVFTSSSFSQTKKIAHRSHSGKDASFTIFGLDNFGETPEMEAARKKRAADKLKADSAAKKATADSIAKLKTLKTKTKTKDGVKIVVTKEKDK